jgi:hypothetical protein
MSAAKRFVATSTAYAQLASPQSAERLLPNVKSKITNKNSANASIYS